MLTRRLTLAVVAATLAAVGLAPVSASATETTKTPSAKAFEHAKVAPGKPYGAGNGRKN